MTISTTNTYQTHSANDLLNTSKQSPSYDYKDYVFEDLNIDNNEENKNGADDTKEKSNTVLKPASSDYELGENSYDDRDTPDIYESYSGDTEMPDPDITYPDYSSNQSRSAENLSDITITKTLLNGTLDEVRRLNSKNVIRFLPEINKINLSLNKKMEVWEFVKAETEITKLRHKDLEAAGKILLTIPEMDLYNLNYSDWEVVNYLGTLPGLSRRQTGVIGYALKKTWGQNIIQNAYYVNQIKGLICAFSPEELTSVTADEFCLLEKDVFKNIRACTTKQFEVLLRTAKLSTVYGPTQAWSQSDTEKLALLVTSLSEYDLGSLRPEAMEGLEYTTIEEMPRHKLLTLSDHQISYLNDLSLAAFRRVIGIDSNNQKTLQCWTCFLFVILSLSLLIINRLFV